MPVRFSIDEDRIGWIVFDDPTARANVFTPDVQAALDRALDEATAAKPRALVVRSNQERIFIAGADLKWLASLADAAAAEAFSRRGQTLFQRIADFPVPVVCAIHGACAGGGFELALACHWRIASAAPVTQIGLPEVGIGTIPGWGGCVRLPRLIGVRPALEHILKAQLIDARMALSAGLVNECVSTHELRARAKMAAMKLAAEPPIACPPPAAPVPELYGELRRHVLSRTHRLVLAPSVAIEAVEQTARLPIADALQIEARLFGQVTAGEVCKNLVHVFFLKEAAKKRTLDGWFEEGGGVPAPRREADVQRESRGVGAPRLQSEGKKCKRVGVVGAGVMGSGIAQWLAVHGFDVVLRDVDDVALARGMEVARRLFDEAVRRGKLTGGEASSALGRIETTSGFAGFSDCDVVIEAIVENAAAKRTLFSELARVVRPDAVLASNTSALPIEEIAGHVPNPERTLGIHFFNPVSRMPLVELIIAEQTSVAAAERALTLVKALRKSPVICCSSPGFLVTRVLFSYLNEAVRLWEDGLDTVAIDAAMVGFGWPMGPLRLIDEVGVDVTDFIFGEMAQYFPTRFERTAACGRLLQAGLRGRKNGASSGFYTYTPKEALNAAATRSVAKRRETRVMEPAQIVGRLMRVMVEEARRCLDEGVVKSPADVDYALLNGAGFPAFRGGLLRWAETAVITTSVAR